MIISSKFNIGQQVRHKLLGFLGVIIDIDAEYSLSKNKKYKKININKKFKKLPWYHVIIEDNNGCPIYTYLAEFQLIWEFKKNHPNQSSLDKLSKKIKKQFKFKKIKN